MNTELTRAERAVWRPNVLSWMVIQRALNAQLIRDAGIPHAYFVILTALADHSDPIPLTHLAAQLDYSQSRMSHAVLRLEEAAWVVRRSDPVDRRVAALAITPLGRAKLNEASVGQTREVRKLFFNHLDSRDLDDIKRIGDKLLLGLSASGGPGEAFRPPPLTGGSGNANM